MCRDIFPAYMSVQAGKRWISQNWNDCEPPPECWELNSSFWEEQQEPLTTEPSHRPCNIVLMASIILDYIHLYCWAFVMDFFAFFFSFIENTFVSHAIYSEYGFSFPNSSRILPTSSQSESTPFLSLIKKRTGI